MGRAKLPPGKRRDFVIRARFRPSDQARIEAAFKASGQATLSDWLRQLVLADFKRIEKVQDLSYHPDSQERKDLGY
jgi:hypothetical protein